MKGSDDNGETRHEGYRVVGTVEAAQECERIGHDPTVGLRFDHAREAMVADCQRCGHVLILDQTSPHIAGGPDA